MIAGFISWNQLVDFLVVYANKIYSIDNIINNKMLQSQLLVNFLHTTAALSNKNQAKSYNLTYWENKAIKRDDYIDFSSRFNNANRESFI